MTELARTLPVAKQAVVEKASGGVIGYAGADYLGFRGQRRLEFGYRLVGRARGIGYATEASCGLLAAAWSDPAEELLAIIRPENHSSKRVARKVGFVYAETAVEFGYATEVWKLGARRWTTEAQRS